MRTLHFIALTLAIIGALNWGLWGLFQFDLVAELFGGGSAALSRIVYTVVGIAGVVALSIYPWLAREPETIGGRRRIGIRRWR